MIEANLDKLLLPETAKKFSLSIGIMEDAEVASPKQTDKGKTKNVEEAVSSYMYDCKL